MPGAKFLRLARAWRKDVEEMVEEPFKYTTESVVCPRSLIDSDRDPH